MNSKQFPNDPTPDNKPVEQDISFERLEEIFGDDAEDLNYFQEAFKYLKSLDLNLTERDRFVFLAVLGSLNFIEIYTTKNITDYDRIISKAAEFMIRHFPELVENFGENYLERCDEIAYSYAEVIDSIYDFIADNLESNAYNQE